MLPIFNRFPNPGLFNLIHFRLSYSLLPAMRRLIERVGCKPSYNVVSIACGRALEVSTLELLARSRNITFNYSGFDINKSELCFNRKFIKRMTHIQQQYIHSDVASNPPVSALESADCIIWRHPEFLSDHDETPKQLIVDMAQILWNVLKNKNKQAPLLINCYDPHEMMLVVELLREFCDVLEYNLHIDTQPGRASWGNPSIDGEDKDPLFNLNHHDQCQLLITKCQLKSTVQYDNDALQHILGKGFQNILTQMTGGVSSELAILKEQLKKPNLERLRRAANFSNNQIRDHENPMEKREQLLAQCIEWYAPSASLLKIELLME